MEYIGAILSITGAVLQTSSKVWALSHEWRDAPAEFHALKDELERTYHFLQDVREGLKAAHVARHGRKSSTLSEPSSSRTALGNFSSDLESLLGQGADVLGEIGQFVEKLEKGFDKVDGAGPGDISKRRRITWMRGSRSIAQWRGQLKAVTLHICRLLLAQNIFVSANIQVSLSQSRDEITAHVDKSIEASREATIQSIESFRDATAAEVRAVLAVSHQAVIAHLNSQLGSGNQPIAGVTAPVFHRIAYQAASECSLHCGCRCHSFARYRWTLTPLQKLLGSFVLEYRDQPPQSCTSTQCLGRGGRPWRSIRVGYTLPPWLLRSSLTILYSSNINGNPEMVLRLVNYLPWDVAHSRGLFGPIKKGDLEGLKELLRQGKASVHDRLLYRTNDRGALDYAVQLGNAAAVPLLLQAGADAHGIRNLILKRLIRGRPEDVSLASEFPVSAFLEDAEFTLLHKVVMGVAHLPLAEALSSPRCIRDVAGRSTAAFLSPLRIAALRDDGEACRLLVEAGAPIDDTDPARSRNTALHEACWNDNYRAARALVLLGASTTRKGSSDGGCALTIAAGAVRARSGTRLLRLILDNGGDVHSTDRKGGTPLLYAATFGSEADGGGGMDRLNLLIDRGSDVNHQDADGDTALVGTVAYNKILFAAALLRGGADPSITNAQDRGVLHFAAMFGSREGLLGLAALGGLLRANSGNCKLDINARDFEGKTPREYFNARDPPPGPELRAAFESFVRAVQGVSDHAGGENGDEDEDSEEEFVDAREVQEV